MPKDKYSAKNYEEIVEASRMHGNKNFMFLTFMIRPWQLNLWHTTVEKGFLDLHHSLSTI